MDVSFGGTFIWPSTFPQIRTASGEINYSFFPQWKAWIILSAIVLRCQWAAAAVEGKVQSGPETLLLTSSLGREGVVNIWCCFKTHILLILISSLPSFLHTAILGVFLKHSPDQSFIFIKIIIDFSFLQTKSRFPAWHPSPLMILISTHLGLNPTLVCCSLYPTGVPLESCQCSEGFLPHSFFREALNCWHPSLQV